MKNILFKKDAFSKINNFNYLNINNESLHLFISNNYNLKIYSILLIDAININSKNYIINTDHCKFVLKLVNKNKLNINNIEVNNYFLNNGINTIKFIKNINGEYIINYDTNYDAILIEYIEGINLNVESLKFNKFIKFINNLYKVSLNTNKNNNLISRKYYFDDNIINNLNKNNCNFLNEDDINLIKNEFLLVKTQLKNKFTECISHIDIHPHNLLINENKNIYLIDFDSFQNSYLEVTISFGIMKCFREFLVDIIETNAINKRIKENIEIIKNEFNYMTFENILNYSKIEYFFRTYIILFNYYTKNNKEWINYLDIQINNIKEINYIINLVKN